MKENIKQIAEKENIAIDDEVLDLIVSRSGGHARNAQMLLDRYKLLGEVFKSSVKTSKDDFAKLILIAIQTRILKSKEGTQKQVEEFKNNYASIIYRLQCNSLSSLKNDYEETILDILKVAVGVKESNIPEINSIAKYISQSRTMYIEYYKILTLDSVINSFKSDKQFQAAMWVLYISL